MTRPLSERESSALSALLAFRFPGVAELRHQASSAMAAGAGPIIDLVVDPSTPVAVVNSRVPVEAPVVDPDGNQNGLLLFVEDGRLSGLEYWWTSDTQPDEFPERSWIGDPVAR